MTDQSAKKEILPEGIYIEAKPVIKADVPDWEILKDLKDKIDTDKNEDVDAYHAYLVYRDGKGNAEVIRGGPERLRNAKIGGKVSIGGWDLFDTGEIDFDVPPTRLVQSGLGGDIEIEAGIPLGKSLDAYKKGETPQSRFAKKLDLGGCSPQKVWEDMKITAQIIGKNETDYNVLSQNSNSTIATVLNRSGLNDGDIFDALEERSGKDYPGKDKRDADTNPDNAPLVDTKPVQDMVKKIRDSREKLEEKLKNILNSDESDENESSQPQPQSQPEAQKPSSDLYPRTPDDLMTFAFHEPDSVLHILRKRPASWTAEERDLVMTDPRYWDGNLIDRDAFQNATRQHFSAVYGDEPMRKDSTGRGIDPPPRYDLPSFPQEPLDPSTGTRLGRGLEAVLKDVISRSQDQGLPAAITDLQQSLNQTRMRTASQLAQPPQPDWLATDGLFGPRTRSALQTQIARIGSEPIRQALSAQGSPPAAAPQPSASAWPAPATPPIWAKPSPKLGAQAPSQTPGSQTPRPQTPGPQTRGSQTPGARTSRGLTSRGAASRGLASKGSGSRDLASRAPRSSGSQSWDQDSQSQDSQSRGFQSQAGSQLAASAPSQHAPRAAPVQSPRGQAVPAKPPKRSSLLNPSGTTSRGSTSRGATSRGLTSRSPGSRGSASRGPASRGLTS